MRKQIRNSRKIRIKMKTRRRMTVLQRRKTVPEMKSRQVPGMIQAEKILQRTVPGRIRTWKALRKVTGQERRRPVILRKRRMLLWLP